jgi:hypothetical protein
MAADNYLERQLKIVDAGQKASPASCRPSTKLFARNLKIAVMNSSIS